MSQFDLFAAEVSPEVEAPPMIRLGSMLCDRCHEFIQGEWREGRALAVFPAHSDCPETKWFRWADLGTGSKKDKR